MIIILCDIILAMVQGDIVEFWEQVVASDQLLVAAPRQNPSYGQTFGPRVRELFQRRYVGRGRGQCLYPAADWTVSFQVWEDLCEL